MDFSVLRGPWPEDRQAGLRRGSHERKIGAGGTRLVYFIIGESCATRNDIICVPYDDHVAGGLALSPALGPEVEGIVKVDIGQ